MAKKPLTRKDRPADCKMLDQGKSKHKWRKNKSRMSQGKACLMTDESGRLWIGCQEGKQTDKSQQIGEKSNSAAVLEQQTIHLTADNPSNNTDLLLEDSSECQTQTRVSEIQHHELPSDSDSGVAEEECTIFSYPKSNESMPPASGSKLKSTNSTYQHHNNVGARYLKQDSEALPKSLRHVRRVKHLPKRSLSLAKRSKLDAMARKKTSHHFFLRSAQKKKSKNKVSKAESARNVPLKIIVKKKLTSAFEELSSPANALQKASTPVNSKFTIVPMGTSGPNIYSCELPYDTSFECSKSGDPLSNPNIHEGPTKKLEGGREICYIFAVLDRENDETLLKSSPEFKTTNLLQQLSSVIQTISGDDDIRIVRKSSQAEYENNLHSCRPSKPVCDSSTSPIPLSCEHCQGSAGADSNYIHQECSEDESASINGHGQSPEISASIKLMVSKALSEFLFKLESLVNISIRLLSWHSISIQGDIDSEFVEDKLEGFLCHSHDKVHLLLACFTMLDSMKILNISEIELKRIWLLHDGLCCMLQSYRYIQSPSVPSSPKQQLISLITTCANMILPNVRLNIRKWTNMMEMVCAIGMKLSEAEALPNACMCQKIFVSIRKGIFCRVCDFNGLYQKMYKLEDVLYNSEIAEEEPKQIVSDKTAVEILFPRFFQFMHHIAEWSKDDFNIAYEKHSAAKFPCNSQCGLYPCNQHLLDIACSCFASGLHVPVSEEMPAEIFSAEDLPCLNERTNSVHPTPDHHTMADKEGTSTKTNAGVSSSADKLSIEVGVPQEELGEKSEKEESPSKSNAVSSKQCESATLKGSACSSDSFTLHIAVSPREAGFEQSKICDEPINRRIDEHEQDSEAAVDSSSIDQSPLDVQQAKCDTQNIHSSTYPMKSHERGGIMKDDSNEKETSIDSISIESSKSISETDLSALLPRNDSFKNNTVSEIKIFDMARNASTLGKTGSITSFEEELDEAPIRDTVLKRQQPLMKSPGMESTFEDISSPLSTCGSISSSIQIISSDEDHEVSSSFVGEAGKLEEQNVLILKQNGAGKTSPIELSNQLRAWAELGRSFNINPDSLVHFLNTHKPDLRAPKTNIEIEGEKEVNSRKLLHLKHDTFMKRLQMKNLPEKSFNIETLNQKSHNEEEEVARKQSNYEKSCRDVRKQHKESDEAKLIPTKDHVYLRGFSEEQESLNLSELGKNIRRKTLSLKKKECVTVDEKKQPEESSTLRSYEATNVTKNVSKSKLCAVLEETRKPLKKARVGDMVDGCCESLGGRKGAMISEEKDKLECTVDIKNDKKAKKKVKFAPVGVATEEVHVSNCNKDAISATRKRGANQVGYEILEISSDFEVKKGGGNSLTEKGEHQEPKTHDIEAKTDCKKKQKRKAGSDTCNINAFCSQLSGVDSNNVGTNQKFQSLNTRASQDKANEPKKLGKKRKKSSVCEVNVETKEQELVDTQPASNEQSTKRRNRRDQNGKRTSCAPQYDGKKTQVSSEASQLNISDADWKCFMSELKEKFHV